MYCIIRFVILIVIYNCRVEIEFPVRHTMWLNPFNLNGIESKLVFASDFSDFPMARVSDTNLNPSLDVSTHNVTGKQLLLDLHMFNP